MIKNLLIINGLFFLATVVLGSTFGIDLGRILGLYMPGSPSFEPYQLVTHMFMHGNLTHIFFNMFALWMFGYTLENVWGSKRFLVYYLVTGLGAAAIHLGVNYVEAGMLRSELIEMGYTASQLDTYVANGSYSNAWPPELQNYVLKYVIPTVGASGAVFGILLAFGMMFPNMYIYIYFAIPIKAKYFVAIYAALELFNGLANDPDSNVAHFAHLGGMLFGYFLIRYWRKSGMEHY